MRLTSAAEVTVSTGRHQCQDYMISRMQATDTRSNLGHDTGAFMTEHDGQWFWYGSVAHMQVAPANAGRLPAHQYFALMRGIQFDFFDDGWQAGFVQHSSSAFHTSTSPYRR